MRKLIMLLVLFYGVNSATAQTPPGGGKKGKPKMTPEQAAQKQADDLEKALTLNADQKATVKSAALTRINKVKEIRKKYGREGDKKAMREEVRTVRKAFADEVNAKLTPDQQTKWKEYRKQKRQEMKGKRQEHKGGKTPPPPPADDDDNDDGSED
jgi:protein CpxP